MCWFFTTNRISSLLSVQLFGLFLDALLFGLFLLFLLLWVTHAGNEGLGHHADFGDLVVGLVLQVGVGQGLFDHLLLVLK